MLTSKFNLFNAETFYSRLTFGYFHNVRERVYYTSYILYIRNRVCVESLYGLKEIAEISQFIDNFFESNSRKIYDALCSGKSNMSSQHDPNRNNKNTVQFVFLICITLYNIPSSTQWVANQLRKV